MRHGSLAFGIFTPDSNCTHFQILDFKILTGISIKGIKVRYADYMNLLSN